MKYNITQLTGNEVESTGPKRTQVYMATHEGENYLPFMKRSFISFSYGGKNIEDFNLIATVSNNMWQQHGYANFNDLTTSYDVIDGQFFWDSHYTTLELDFELSTDSMTQQQLDEFLRWFQPGKYKELVLAEHPNRARLARVRSVPEVSMIPFEYKTEVMIDGTAYETSTTEYKGSITLGLVSDDPFWYGKVSVFSNAPNISKKINWYDANGVQLENLDIYTDKDILKVILEDGVPALSMVDQDNVPYMIFGDNIYIGATTMPSQQVASLVSGSPPSTSIKDGYHQVSEGNGKVWYYGAVLPPSGYEPDDEQYYAMTAGSRIADMDDMTDAGIDLKPITDMTGEEGESAIDYFLYFYYAGTAPSPLTLSFKLTPQFNGDGYITTPANKRVPIVINGKSYQYNCITIESKEKQELHITTPNIYTSYNQVIDIFKRKQKEGRIYIENLIRDTVRHGGVRAWAMHSIESNTTNEQGQEVVNWSGVINTMKSMFYSYPVQSGEDPVVLSSTYSIDSKTGKATGTFSYREYDEKQQEENNRIKIKEDSVENVQDMLVSSNLIIKERNFPNSLGKIEPYGATTPSASTEDNKEYSHRLYHNFPNGLQEIKLKYKNLYL